MEIVLLQRSLLYKMHCLRFEIPVETYKNSGVHQSAAVQYLAGFHVFVSGFRVETFKLYPPAAVIGSAKHLNEREHSFGFVLCNKYPRVPHIVFKNISYAAELWNKNMRKYADTVKVFDGITELLKNLLRLDCEMGIVTSKTREEKKQDFSHFNISHYFKTIVCADDTQRHKPNAAPLLKYLEISKADCRQTLYIGDSKYDSMCAENAGIDFALAVWGSRQTSIKADYFLKNPMDLLSLQ